MIKVTSEQVSEEQGETRTLPARRNKNASGRPPTPKAPASGQNRPAAQVLTRGDPGKDSDMKTQHNDDWVPQKPSVIPKVLPAVVCS